MMAQAFLVAVICPSCGRRLAETLPQAQVYCPTCGRWCEVRDPHDPPRIPAGKCQAAKRRKTPKNSEVS